MDRNIITFVGTKGTANDFFFKSSPEDMLIDFTERGREVEREGEKQ